MLLASLLHRRCCGPKRWLIRPSPTSPLSLLEMLTALHILCIWLRLFVIRLQVLGRQFFGESGFAIGPLITSAVLHSCGIESGTFTTEVVFMEPFEMFIPECRPSDQVLLSSTSSTAAVSQIKHGVHIGTISVLWETGVKRGWWLGWNQIL